MIKPGPAHFVKLHKDAVIPTYKSRLAACCDVQNIEEVMLRPREYLLVRTGLVCIPPEGWHWQVYLRSGTPLKYPGLILANCVGIIDGDYTGPEDELKLILLNQTVDRTLVIPKHTRVCQMRLTQDARPTKMVEATHEQIQLRRSRGGFGSTGF